MMARFKPQVVQIPDAAGIVCNKCDEFLEALYHSGCQAVLYESAESCTLRHESSRQSPEGASPLTLATSHQSINAR